MGQVDVREQVLQRFGQPLRDGAARRIVMWHDADGEFEGVFDELAEKGFDDALSFEGAVALSRPLRFLKASEGSCFSVKKELYRNDVTSDFLVYRRRGRGNLEGDWLADVEMYAEHFQADYLSLLVDQLHAADSDDVRAALAEFKGFFAAKSRRVRFSACCPEPSSSSDVKRGVLAAVLGPSSSAVDSSVDGIIRYYLCRLLEGEDVGAVLDKYQARDALAALMKRVMGYEGELDDVSALGAHLLLTALHATMPESELSGLQSCISPAHDNFCLGIVRSWMKAADERERGALYEMCRRVEGERNLPERFAGRPLSSLEESDVFPCVNEVIIRDLMHSIAQGADRCDETRRVIARRRDLKWYKRVEPFFDALGTAASMSEFYRSHVQGFHLGDTAQIWRAYVNDWHDMDAFYRHFCLAYDGCVREAGSALDADVRELGAWAENLYSNWFLAESNACWTRAAEGQWGSAGHVDGPDAQRGFYHDVVVPELAGVKRVAVIVSDALRYEVACELQQRLEQRLRGHVMLGSLQGVFPSVTEFGMAALLPHRVLELREEDGGVYADGMPTASTAQREAVLAKERPGARAIQSKELLDMGAAERKSFAESSDVIYVYHNKIDSTGESYATESDVFAACERALSDLCTLVKIITGSMGISRVIVTADHGFLYQRGALSEADRISLAALPGEPVLQGRRYLVVRQGAQSDACSEALDDAFVRMNMNDVDGDVAGFAPRGCARIKQPGGAERYVHGGVSLQELCVPVLRFRAARGHAKDADSAQSASLQLLSTNRRITNSLFTVDLLQREPVSGKVVPCEYVLVFVDSSGNEVSDVRSVHADKESSDEQARILRAQFVLKSGRRFSSSEAYYLLVRERGSGSIAWKEEYRIDVSFAPVDDFGF